MTTDKYTVLVI